MRLNYVFFLFFRREHERLVVSSPRRIVIIADDSSDESLWKKANTRKYLFIYHKIRLNEKKKNNYLTENYLLCLCSQLDAKHDPAKHAEHKVLSWKFVI